MGRIFEMAWMDDEERDQHTKAMSSDSEFGFLNECGERELALQRNVLIGNR